MHGDLTLAWELQSWHPWEQRALVWPWRPERSGRQSLLELRLLQGWDLRVSYCLVKMLNCLQHLLGPSGASKGM